MNKLFTWLPLVTTLIFSSSVNAAFEGEISPRDAFDWASSDPSVYILDVRTGEEWKWVGHPGPNALVNSKKGKAKGLNYNEGAGLVDKVVNIASLIEAGDGTGGLKTNADFISDVQAEFPDPNEVTLLVICRSGSRAQVAALALAGLNYTTYNVADGFQGPSNNEDDPGRDTGYRDVAGWVNDGLPWNQNRTGGYYVDYTPD